MSGRLKICFSLLIKSDIDYINYSFYSEANLFHFFSVGTKTCRNTLNETVSERLKILSGKSGSSNKCQPGKCHHRICTCYLTITAHIFVHFPIFQESLDKSLEQKKRREGKFPYLTFIFIADLTK